MNLFPQKVHALPPRAGRSKKTLMRYRPMSLGTERTFDPGAAHMSRVYTKVLNVRNERRSRRLPCGASHTHNMMWFDVEEQWWNHRYCFLAGNVALGEI